MSKEQRIMKKTRKKPVLSALCSLFSVNRSLLTVLCSLLIVSCDIDPDFMQRIDDEIAWSNAARLTVVLNFPGSWGQGSITTIAENRRLGYDFDINFTPAQGYSIESWRAYKTDDIETYRDSQGVNWNWMQDAYPAAELIKMEDAIGALKWGKDKDIELISTPQSGFGTFVFKINITDNVTIVPLCNNAPEIKQTDPPMKEAGAALDNFPPTHTIIVELTSPVDHNTVRLEEDYIEIYARDLLNGEPTGTVIDLTESGYFTARWNAGLWRIIIEPTLEGASYVENKMLTVVLGKEIKNINDFSIAGINETQSISFSWKTNSLTTTDVIKLEAVYDEEEGTITVEWILSASHSARISYTVNNSQRRQLESETGTNVIMDIEEVQPLFTGGVRSGQEVSNIQRYDIWLQLHDAADDIYRDSGFPVTIWNFDGMKVSRANPAELINSAEDFRPVSAGGKIVTDAAGANKNYVLTRNIQISTHTPISNFQGSFYGNGHTVTISSLGGTGAERGLFGVATDALIRDLTVAYSNMTITAGNATHIGGIVGNATGNTSIINCIVRGANFSDTLSISAASLTAQEIRIGGIAGNFEGSGFIQNCRAALPVSYTSGGHDGEVRIGGIAGEIGEGGTANTLPINNGYTGGTAAQGPNVTLQRLLINGVTVSANVSADKNTRWGIISIGGAVGRSGRNTMNDVVYTNGTVSFGRSTSSTNYCGGLIGHSVLTSVTDCSFSGNIGTINNAQVLGQTYLGGLIGYNVTDQVGVYFINNCTIRTNIEFSGNNSKQVGGIIGWSDLSAGSIIITNCFFERGNIIVRGSATTEAGGFSGWLQGQHIMSNCGVIEGTINVNTSSGAIYVGGFTSDFRGHISNCFSNMNIITRSTTLSYVGGFIGVLGILSTDSSVSNCYATGTVFSVIESTPSDIFIGGLVGNIRARGEIRDSYALGNVLTDSRSGTGSVSVGGLVGGLSGVGITNSFSAGQVTAQSSSASSTIYAGGLVGNRTSGTISNSAALGTSVTVQTPGTRGVGRIYGSPTTNIGTNNFTRESMRVETSSVYNDNNPSVMNFSSVPVMLGIPTLGGSVSAASISGLTAADNGGMNLASVTMSAGGTASFAAGTGIISVSGIDLSSLTNTSLSLSRTFTLINSAGNSAIYRIEIRPGRNNTKIVFEEEEIEEHIYTLEEEDGEIILKKETITKTITVAKEIADPLTLADFIVSGPNLISTTMAAANAAGPYGRAVADSSFYNPSIWTNTAANGGLNFSVEHWNFSGVVREGFPRIRGLSGQ